MCEMFYVILSFIGRSGRSPLLHALKFLLGKNHSHQPAQKISQPVAQEVEVVACACQVGVGAVTFRMGDVVSVHAMPVLDVADDGFDRFMLLHLPFLCWRDVPASGLAFAHALPPPRHR
jgi:hypothetical protein